MIDTRQASPPRSVPSTVAGLMRRDVVTVSPSTSIRELIQVFREHGISGLPVIDQGRKVVGMVSVTDLMWLSDRLAGDETDFGDRARAAQPLSERTVGDVMTPDVFGVEPDATIAELAAFFARTGLGRAPVLEDGRLVGIVSVIDLLTILADLPASQQSR